MEKMDFHGVGQVMFQKSNAKKERDKSKFIYNRGREQLNSIQQN